MKCTQFTFNLNNEKGELRQIGQIVPIKCTLYTFHFINFSIAFFSRFSTSLLHASTSSIFSLLIIARGREPPSPLTLLLLYEISFI